MGHDANGPMEISTPSVARSQKRNNDHSPCWATRSTAGSTLCKRARWGRNASALNGSEKDSLVIQARQQVLALLGPDTTVTAMHERDVTSNDYYMDTLQTESHWQGKHTHARKKMTHPGAGGWNDMLPMA